ncbi:MAG: S9 family peptidase [Melioribacteraceae bacterium]|nr:S9 family peptidase [Melioribacteraceae bacterium]
MRRSLIVISILSFVISLFAQEKTIITDSYLIVGPIKTHIPAFAKIDSDTTYQDLLKFESLDLSNIKPAEGELLNYNGTEFRWTKNNSGEKLLLKPDMKLNEPQCYYAVCYLENSEWMKSKLIVESGQMFQVYVNGKAIGEKHKVEKKKNDDDKVNKLSKELEFETGKHTIIIKSMFRPNSTNEWYLKTWMEADSAKFENVKFTVNPIGYTTVSNLLDDKKASRISLSADGLIAGVEFTKRTGSKEKSESWLELYSTEDGSLIETFRGGMEIRNIDWSPKDHIFAYRSDNNLWVNNLESGRTTLLIEEEKDLSGFEWSPTGEYLIYTLNEKEKSKKGKLIKYKSLADRLPWGNDKSYIYKVSFPSGIKTRLTKGEISTDFNSISNDGGKIIFTRSKPYYSERPFSKTAYYVLDMATMKVDSLFKDVFVGGAVWSPDNKNLLITGGPSSFNNAGLNLSSDKTPNDYDTQAYMYNFKTKKIRAITKEFNPSISSVKWIGNKIYFSTIDKSFKHLYEYDVVKDTFEIIDLGVENLSQIKFSQNGERALFMGSSSNVPGKVFIYRVEDNSKKLLTDPQKKEYNKIKLAKVEDFSFQNDENKDILGRVYFPVNYDESKKYPVIVYYYAGTSPVTREFEGRYPKNIWAANGYFVYIVQPSGCFGFGQDHSAVHVNDWGDKTAKEIIQGTEKLLENYPAMDKNRLGCIGASYGGFMTMNLITKTDMFAAAVSHAGISALSSYWGEGYWGYGYSAVASANSYPWNNAELYTKHSPLFNADKINTPLLLLHGNSDTNVPRGESVQMYVALKLLGKDVDFLEVEGQDHHIMDYEKRILWTKAIIAYFDRQLKNNPDWWNAKFKK